MQNIAAILVLLTGWTALPRDGATRGAIASDAAVPSIRSCEGIVRAHEIQSNQTPPQRRKRDPGNRDIDQEEEGADKSEETETTFLAIDFGSFKSDGFTASDILAGFLIDSSSEPIEIVSSVRLRC
jgi:hypothetical protein